ncbi:hypothetical protein ACFX14_043775 [Malus domestica]
MASTIADRIAQRKGSVMPLGSKFVPRCLLGVKSSSPLERLATMNSDKVDSTAKVALRPTHFAAETDSLARKEETAHVGSYEKSIKPASGEAAEICVLWKLDLLEDMDACANTAAKDVAKTMVAEAYSSAEEIKRLNSKLVALKGSNIFAPTSLQFRFKILSLQFLSFVSLLMQRIKSRLLLIIKLPLVKQLEKLVPRLGQPGEASDDATAKNVTAAEGVATE